MPRLNWQERGNLLSLEWTTVINRRHQQSGAITASVQHTASRQRSCWVCRRQESNLQVHPRGLDDGREMARAIHSATSFLFVRPREIHQMLTGINPGWQPLASLRSRDTFCRSLVTLYDEKFHGWEKKNTLVL